MGIYSFEDIIFSLFLTITIYSMPIIIYRYMIIKAAVDIKSARAITISYGICSFIVMSSLHMLINGRIAKAGPILLWSYINYCILTSGKQQRISKVESLHIKSDTSEFEQQNILTVDNSAIDSESVSGQNIPDFAVQEDEFIVDQKCNRFQNSEVKYCNQCGNILQPGSFFCSSCGVSIEGKIKKSTSCGKRHTRSYKKIFLSAVFTIIFLSLIGLNIYQYITIENNLKKISDQKIKIDSMNDRMVYYQDKALFLDNYIVLIGSGSNKYHRYGCKYLDASSFFAYNTENAEALGYKSCVICCN